MTTRFQPKYTRGPYRVALRFLMNSDGTRIAKLCDEKSISGPENKTEASRNADRVTSCMNALDGFQDPAAVKPLVTWTKELVDKMAAFNLGVDVTDHLKLIARQIEKLEGIK